MDTAPSLETWRLCCTGSNCGGGALCTTAAAVGVVDEAARHTCAAASRVAAVGASILGAASTEAR